MIRIVFQNKFWKTMSEENSLVEGENSLVEEFMRLENEFQILNQKTIAYREECDLFCSNILPIKF